MIVKRFLESHLMRRGPCLYNTIQTTNCVEASPKKAIRESNVKHVPGNNAILCIESIEVVVAIVQNLDNKRILKQSTQTVGPISMESFDRVGNNIKDKDKTRPIGGGGINGDLYQADAEERSRKDTFQID